MHDTNHRAERLEQLSRMLFAATVALLPLFFIPWGFPLPLAKVVLFGVLSATSLGFYLVAEIQRGEIRLPRGFFFAAATLLPVVYVVSAILSESSVHSWFGSGGTGTVYFMALAYLAFASPLVYVRNVSDARTLLSAVFVGGALVLLFQLLIFVAAFLSVNILSTPSQNLVGRWGDLSMYSAVLLLASCAALQFLRIESFGKGLLVFLAGASALVLFLANLHVAWGVLLAASLVLFAFGFFAQGHGEVTRRVPFIALFLVVFSGSFFLYGENSLSVNRSVAATIGIAEVDARPTLESTIAVIKGTYAEGAVSSFLGGGPGTFDEKWRIYKPQEVNASVFWGIDFEEGFGTVPTALVSTGLLGGLAWLLFIVGLAYTGLRTLVRAREGDEEGDLGLIAFFGALCVFLAALVYPLGGTVLLIGFVLAGIAAPLSREEGEPRASFSLQRESRERTIAGFLIVFISLSAIGLFGKGIHAGALEALYVSSVGALGEADLTRAGKYSDLALSIHRSDRVLRLKTEIGIRQLQMIAESPDTADAKQQFEATLRPTLDYALEAVRYDSLSYLNWLSLARAYDFLSSLGVQGAYDNAKASYAETIRRNPTNPSTLLSLARLEIPRGNYTAARDFIAEALELKGNYTEAVMLTVQLEYARGNLDAAATAARAAVATAPQNPHLWFELGLLLYTKGDSAGAVDAFKQSLTFEPSYANAKYFLGLSLERVGLTSQAVAVFEELRTANPNNTEISLILTNLRLGKPPFSGLGVSSDPAGRTFPPIAD